ncbi:hypothetical protein Mettu_3708, partial [Methylobacter tundripaludum SV96]
CGRSCNGCARSIWTLMRTRICRSSCWSMPCNRPAQWPAIRYSRSCWPCRTPPGRAWTCRDSLSRWNRWRAPAPSSTCWSVWPNNTMPTANRWACGANWNSAAICSIPQLLSS